MGKRSDASASGDLAGQLQGGLDCIGPRGPGELQFVVHPPRREDNPLELFDKPRLRSAVKVQGGRDAVLLNIVQQLFFQTRVIVAIVQ